MTKTILILAIAAAFVVGTIATGWQIYAQAPPSGSPGEILLPIAGAGIGTVICANTDEFNNVLITINFDVPGAGPEVFLRNEDDTRQQHRSTLFTAELTQNAYNLNGLFKFESDPSRIICDEIPVLVTVSGDCGIGVAITLVAPGSMTGAFVGNVACV